MAPHVFLPAAGLHYRARLLLEAERLERAERRVVGTLDDAACPLALRAVAAALLVVVFLVAVAIVEPHQKSCRETADLEIKNMVNFTSICNLQCTVYIIMLFLYTIFAAILLKRHVIVYSLLK